MSNNYVLSITDCGEEAIAQVLAMALERKREIEQEVGAHLHFLSFELKKLDQSAFPAGRWELCVALDHDTQEDFNDSAAGGQVIEEMARWNGQMSYPPSKEFLEWERTYKF